MIYYTISVYYVYIYIFYLTFHIFGPALANSGGGGAGPLGGAGTLIFASASWTAPVSPTKIREYWENNVVLYGFTGIIIG